MHRRTALHRRSTAALALLAALAVLAACSGTSRPAERPADGVVVASFDFAESAVLGELYAQALEQAGVPVRRQLRLGPRELDLPALRQGLVDVVPEYLGSVLATVVPGAVATRPGAARDELAAALRGDGLQVLSPASAQNENGLAVTRATAERGSLRRTSDLVPRAAGLSLAGPAECPRRPYCLLGLQRVYGISFGRFVAYDAESQRVTALEQGVVDVAVVFTTDGLLAAGDLVLLDDDRGLQPVDNVVPVVSSRALDRYGARVTATLDAVSAQLDSAGLRFLNWRVDVAGHPPSEEAHGWLVRHHLLRP